MQADEPKSESLSPPTGAKVNLSLTDDVADNKSGRKRRKRVRRKNAPKKSSSVNQLTTSQTLETLEVTELITDRSSIDSNSSDPELKDVQQ